MRLREPAGALRLGLFFLTAIGIVGGAMFLGDSARADDAGTTGNKKIAELIALNKHFIGSTSCKSCHGDPAADPGTPAKKGSEYTVWSTSDKHSQSFTALSSDLSKQIASKGGYGDPTASDKCLSCHALNVPAALQGSDFKLAEGNSCESCHGPAESWSGSDGSPHKTKGWAEKRREADGYDPVAKAKDDGFWDVEMPALRADNCASCHMAIDDKMVAAGHPQPAFEINEYGSREPAHWNDKHSDQYYCQLWAAGQIACTRDAMTALSQRAASGADAALITAAYNQAMAHATMFQILVTVDGGVGSEVKDDLNTAMTALQATKGTDAASIKDPAAKIADLADKVFTADVPGFAPDVTCTSGILDKVLAASDDMAKNYDRRGAEQAAYAARWLYLSKAWDSDPKKELPADLVAEYDGFFASRAQPLGADAAKFADAIGKIKAGP